MWWSILLAILIIFLLYCLLPSYWARNRSKKVLRKGQTQKKQIALTFDDGPNPNYTPRLLDILKEHQVTATFFTMGKQAKLYPDIIKRMDAEGHALGIHSYSHRHAWLMSPTRTIRDMIQTYNILEHILGNPPKWYRPPWGTFNLISIFAAERLDLKTAYWSIEAQDWDKNTTVEHIYNTVIKKVHPGAIIVLHDNQGAPGAPERTLKALPTIIKSLKGQGYEFVSLDRMKGEYYAKANN
ncbi:MAG: polysaccharide deacetylase family protein [Caldicoprobacterales bacterium]|jgi:peptidoglycan/xylan/chitin deacetylase (PgdA/CDA1 family)|nr:polysaccharide deacetylase family protein [Clostridiales bacterium]